MRVLATPRIQRRPSSGHGPSPSCTPWRRGRGFHPLGPGLILHLGGSSPPKIKFLQHPSSFESPPGPHPRKPTHRALCTDSQGPGQEETHSCSQLMWGELHTLHPLPRTSSQTQGRQNPHPIHGDSCLASVTLSTHTGRHLAGTHFHTPGRAIYLSPSHSCTPEWGGWHHPMLIQLRNHRGGSCFATTRFGLLK